MQIGVRNEHSSPFMKIGGWGEHSASTLLALLALLALLVSLLSFFIPSTHLHEW